jgi:hypothetical protein
MTARSHLPGRAAQDVCARQVLRIFTGAGVQMPTHAAAP